MNKQGDQMDANCKKYERVYNHIDQLIKNGTLKEGSRVPSLRSTASNLGVGLLTVLEGYSRLENDGFIMSRPQSGYFVHNKILWKPQKKTLEPATVDKWPQRIGRAKLSDHVTTLIQQAEANGFVKLGGGLPDPNFFPSVELARHMARVARNHPNTVNQYSLAPGALLLREQISRVLINSGAEIGPGELCIIPGGTAGILLALRSVCRSGDLIAIESPGYFGFYSAAEFLGLNVIEVPSDPQTGVQLDTLESVLKKQSKVRCLLLSSNNSNPTGASLPESHKERLAFLARQYKIVLIEDETYGELTFGSRRPLSLRSFDKDNVITLGSFNKILAPGYRIGWIAGGKYQKKVVINFNAAYMSTPLVNQLAVASFLKEEGLRKHIRRIRKRYAAQLTLYKTAILNTFPPTVKVSNPSGGHFLWIELPPGCDSAMLSAAAAENKISIAPGVIFSGSGHHLRFFRINCACEWTEKIPKALRTIGKLIVS